MQRPANNSKIHMDDSPLPATLPVSAAELGLIKREAGHTPSASSIMQDAMAESKVAHAVRQFIHSQADRGN